MKLAQLSIALFSLFFAVQCTKKSKGDYGLDVKETIRVNLSTEPPSLDWNKATDTTSSQITDNIMEGLVEFDLTDKDLSLIPALASEWTATEGAKVWTFSIRQGVTWSDGVAFEAQQVLDGWERLLNPKTASEYAYFLYGVKNAKEYNEGKIKDFSKVGVQVNDKGQIVVELVGPQSYFPQLLTHHSTYPIRKDIIEKFGDKWTEAGNLQGLGAYNLKTWDHDKAIVLERNEKYYGSPAKTKYVLGYMINESLTAINLFDSDKLDAQLTLPSSELSKLRTRKEFRSVGILSLYYFGFNTKKAPLDNVLVRKAIAQAIDRSEVTTMLGGGQIPMTSWVPSGMFGYSSDIGLKFDVEKAKADLEKAGYKDPSKLPKITMSFNTNEDHQRIAENIQAQLKRNLGISVELRNEEWKVYLNTLQANTPQVYRMGWLADYPDPDNFLSLMASYSENNHTNWENKKFDELIKKAASTTNKEERRKLYDQAQKILVEEDVPVVPIHSSVVQVLVSDRLGNFPVNSLNRFKYKDVVIK